jgi:kynureninase
VVFDCLCLESQPKIFDRLRESNHTRLTVLSVKFKFYCINSSLTNYIDDSKIDSGDESIYLCGNSLGLPPRRVKSYIASYLNTWASLGVYGHFKDPGNALTVPWVRIDEQTRDAACKIVGALPDEVAVMQSLTANLHLLMASFYRPTKERYKIIIEGKAFPSDHVCGRRSTAPGFQTLI